MPDALLVEDQMDTKSDPGQLEWDNATVWSTANASIQSPYSVPAKFDFGRLHSLVSAQITDLEDHIWTLREDPGYFTETFDAFHEHRLEMIRGANGERDPALKRPASYLHSFIIRDIVFEAYFELFLCVTVHGEGRTALH
ncbi:hypothetical protein CC86DRAFT_196347 [Ophiobolus disseminans]|uniref:Uncharacterized protein n=1 Tax=Ophiobolus disseminans TaxID=1469910 RepID=A0A6A7A7A2_9PLEO|nr:hypothetical protein CC86DRAFT_196347 [Ophiobolus disseminans]